MGTKSEEKKLLDLFDRLTSEQQDKLIAFAELLTTSVAEAPAAEPVAIPRPARETVTMAIRRLVRAYPMLDRRRLMGEAAQLMAQHALQGRPSVEVINELEKVFARHYEQFRAKGERRKAK
jgi:hypothetical protein